jgi:two-component system, NtrC family, response regulator AtoC
LANPIPSQSERLLVVSRERHALSVLWAIAEANGWELETAGSGWEALERVQAGTRSGAVVLDIAPGDAEGMHTLRWLRRVGPELPIIVLSHDGDEEQRRESLRLGASEHLVRPLDEQLLEAVIRRCFEERDSAEAGRATEGIEPVGEDSFFVAINPAMRKLRAQAELLAQVNAPLLIVGEVGSGKELTARLIHKLSGRPAFRFLKVDCAALAHDSAESDLFGPLRKFEATNGSSSKLELCHNGTLLLDEITAMPMSLQARLLHLLQAGHSAFRGEDGGEIDVHIIATTRMNVEQAVAERKLRQDLYYRLSAFTVHVPALRQRKEEIPVYLAHFMSQLARRHGLPSRPFSQAVLDACQAYSWPGNVRELEVFVKQHLMAAGEAPKPGPWSASHGMSALEPEPTQPVFPEAAPAAGPVECEPGPAGLKSLLQNVRGETERNAIATALEQTRWNRKAAAQLLKVSYRTLLYKIQQYHMAPPDPSYSYVSSSSVKGTEREPQEFDSGIVRENRS